jgi:hypothetical protein
MTPMIVTAPPRLPFGLAIEPRVQSVSASSRLLVELPEDRCAAAWAALHGRIRPTS